MRSRKQSGVALIATLLILVLMSALLIGFTMLVMGDKRLGGIDRDRTRAFYAAHAGMEKLTADLGTLFGQNYAAGTNQINALRNSPPALPGVQFTASSGSTGYAIDFPLDADGSPKTQNLTILSGPYQGFTGLLTPFTINVTARTLDGSEVQLRRTLQTVSIPVFQFGIFSETDLSFFAGPNFSFGGRVHTNGNLFLAEGNGNTLTMSDRVTAVREVVRTNLSNGWNNSSNYTGTVRVLQAPSTFRSLAPGEGSLTGTIGSSLNEPLWTNLSIGTYNGNLRNSRTGAKPLNLPLGAAGGSPVDLIRRPDVGEKTANSALYGQRYYKMASLRILLSDTETDITSLPDVVGNPVSLNGTTIPGVDAPGVDPQLAQSDGSASYRSPDGTPLTGGFIKVDLQDQNGNWTDVTVEVLNRGYWGADLLNNRCGSATAIIRIQRAKDDVSNAPCPTTKTNSWPNALYDERQGNPRDVRPTGTDAPLIYLGGVMNYIELDVANLSAYLLGKGVNVMKQTGFVVYFSDRRTNRNWDAGINGAETGEYGFEDFVNPASAAGTPNGIRDAGEDVNGNGVLDVYGQYPLFPSVLPIPVNGDKPVRTVPLLGAWKNWATTAALLAAGSQPTIRPFTLVDPNVARSNRLLLFRRALKIVNGGAINIGTCDDGVVCGLTVVSENSVYVQGNYNSDGTFTGAHVAASIIADSFSFLSNNWNDRNSFGITCANTAPAHDPGCRPATTTWYRTAIIAGKGISFPQPIAFSTPQDFGTDGGVHNFLRFLENWGGQTLNYRGSIVSFYYNRQGVGIYKCCTTVYGPPTRGYNFDVEFLQPQLLPPRTPMFQDVNTTGFSQIIRAQ